MSGRETWWLAGLSLLFAGVVTTASWNRSATADEPIYAAAGLRILQTGDLRTNEISSPWLLKAVVAAPLWLMGERMPEADLRMRSDRLALHWQSAWEWLGSSSPDGSILAGTPETRLRVARGMNTTLAVLAAWCVFGLGCACASRRLGFWAAVVFLAWPETLAHAGVGSLDMGLTLLTVATLWAARPLVEPSARCAWRWPLTGLLLGLTFLAKSAAVTLAGFLVLAVFVPGPRWHEGRSVWGPDLRRRVGRVGVIGVVAWLTLQAGFGGDGTLSPLRTHPDGQRIEARLTERWGSGVGECVGSLPSPLPTSYLRLLVTQAGIGEGGKPVYFRGEVQRGGWWWFLPVAFLIKTPLPLVGLLLLGVWSRWGTRERWLVGGYAAFVGAFFLVTDRFGLVRYLLPIVPCFALMIAAPLTSWGSGRTGRRARALVGVALALPVVSAYPHYLAYSASWAGGPASTWRWLSDSNVDWGQDLPAVFDDARRRGFTSIALGYFGSGRPDAAPDLDIQRMPSVGVEPVPGQPWWFDDVPTEPIPWPLDRPLYLSATLYHGVQLPGVYAPLADRAPDAVVAPSILLFLPEAEAE